MNQAMAFHHSDGLSAAWKQAMCFAGSSGRIGSMPDIVEARLGTKPGNMPWETYFTTSTAEYFGESRKGNLILIVVHGVGPMSTLSGVQKAYRWEYSDKSRDRRGGRITLEEFRNLESGKYGEVSIVDLEAYVRRYEYPFNHVLCLSEAMTDPVVKARFGPLTERYVEKHANEARKWHAKQAEVDPENRYNLPGYEKHLAIRRKMHRKYERPDSDPHILRVEDAANCGYYVGKQFRHIESGYAVAHLISTGRLSHLHHEGGECLVLDVSCHEWWNGVRFVGVRAGTGGGFKLVDGPNPNKLLQKHWRELFVPTQNQVGMGFRSLVKIGEQWFTEYPKVGERMDTGEPEFMVTAIEKIGSPIRFGTSIGGYKGFFKYGIKEVQAIAPPRANAYCLIGVPKITRDDMGPDFHTCKVQFYKVEVDVSRRLMRSENLERDYDLMMRLIS